jgi:hypothetical protein
MSEISIKILVCFHKTVFKHYLIGVPNQKIEVNKLPLSAPGGSMRPKCF